MQPAKSFPGVTAVVPAYNMQQFVARTLHSALAQTYPNLKVIVIDDGSTDRTENVVREIAAQNSNVRFERVRNCGVAAVRNLGTELASTPYVAYLDADDLWHPTKIEKQVSSLLRHRSDDWVASYALYRMIDEYDRVIENGPPTNARGSFFDEHLAGNPVGNGSNILVLREAALAVGGFNPEYAQRGIGGCEDLEFQLKLLRKQKIELVPEYLVGYRRHKDQMSADVGRMGLGRIAVLEYILEGSEDTELGRMTMARANMAAARCYLQSGNPARAVRFIGRAFTLNGDVVGRHLRKYAAATARRTVAHAQRCLSLGRGNPCRARTFDQMNPMEDFERRMRLSK